MATDVSVQLGYKDSAWFAANPTFLLGKGQIIHLEQTSTYKLGDGVTALSALSFLGGSGVQSVTGPQVDNTDPLNPIINTPTLQEIADSFGGAGANTTTPLTYNSVGLATIEELVTTNIVAENDHRYSLVTSSVFTDPTPVNGKGYTIILNTLQTATVGGVAYSGWNGVILKRYYNGIAWVTRTYYSNTANLGIYEALSNKGVANGYVPLNSSALIDSTYLPAYVDDIVEGYLLTGVFYSDISHTLPITGLASVIYVDLTAGQSSKQYRWSGSSYIQITNGLIASTSDVSEGSNLYFTNPRALAAAPAETATTIATINHGAAVKTTLVDADEITGQDSASAFSLIRVTCLNIYNYLKSKFDLVYTPIALRGYVSGGNFTTTSLTLVDITGLSVALAANSIYEFDIKLTYESSSNAGLNTGVNFSAAGATIEAGEVGARDAEVGKVVRLNAFNTPHATAAWLRISTTPQTHEIKGIVRTGANAGNLTAQILKVSSGTATVYIDSYIRAQKV